MKRCEIISDKRCEKTSKKSWKDTYKNKLFSELSDTKELSVFFKMIVCFFLKNYMFSSKERIIYFL